MKLKPGTKIKLMYGSTMVEVTVVGYEGDVLIVQ